MTTAPFEVSRLSLKRSGAVSGLGAATASFFGSIFLASSEDEHPISASSAGKIQRIPHRLRIVIQYAMLKGAATHGALRRFCVVLQPLLERGVSQPGIPDSGA